MKNQIPLRFHKDYCIRTDKTWYEPNEYVMTSEEKSHKYKLNKNRWCLQCLKHLLKRTWESQND